jgi:hypothetical protein
MQRRGSATSCTGDGKFVTALAASGDVSCTEITPTWLLTSLRTVDGAGSQLDADVLDGFTSAEFVRPGNVVWVCATSDAAANGTRLLDAAAAATGTASNPALLHLEPGTFDLGAGVLAMQPYVSIEGSGIGLTTITSTGATIGATTDHRTLDLADNSELHDVTVRVTGGSAGTGRYVAAWSNDDTAILERARLVASGAATNERSALLIEGTTPPTIREMQFDASGATSTQAVDVTIGNEATIEDSKLVSSGRGVRTTSRWVTLRGVRIEAGSGDGVQVNLGQVVVEDSEIIVNDPAPNGIGGIMVPGPGSVRVRHSVIDMQGGGMNGWSIRGFDNVVFDTLIKGQQPISTPAKCAEVYREWFNETFTELDVTCQ